MRIFIAVIGLAAVAVAGTWAWTVRSWDSYTAFAAAVFALVGANVWEYRRSTGSRVQQQHVERGGVAIQSGRDTNIGTSRDRDHA